MRASTVAATAAIGDETAGAGAAARSLLISSTYVFHSAQSGHRPSHLGETAPQDWQAKTVVTLGRTTSSREAVGRRRKADKPALESHAYRLPPAALP